MTTIGTSETTLATVKLLAQTVIELKAMKKAADDAATEAQKAYDTACAQFYNVLEAAEMDRFDWSGHMLLRTVRSSVTVPKGDDKLYFFEYLRNRGIFDELVTVNSNSLNAWFNAEQEAALRNGQVEFQVPGLTVWEYPKLQVRSK
jgi:hypothetical protein